MATEQLVRPVEVEDGKPSPPPMNHIRCCKQFTPKGLCGCGGPPVWERSKRMYPGPTSDTCSLCHEMWVDGHNANCPRDNGKW